MDEPGTVAQTAEEENVADVRAEAVRSAASRREFIAYPQRLYRDAKEWVPPFDADMRAYLSRKHPYFDTTPSEFFLLRSGDRTVGRVAVMLNRRYNTEHDVRSVHFYFADFDDEPRASDAVFATAANWAASQGMDTLIGPLFSGATMGGGVLIRGFEHSAAMTMMGYNHAYYRNHYERSGFRKRFDLLSLRADPRAFSLPDRVEKVADRVRTRGRFTVARIRSRRELRRIADEVGELYNATLADHPENYPVTPRELEAIKKDLLLAAKPDLEKAIRYDGEVVGYILSFPDLSAAMQRNRGKLGPLRILRLLTEAGRTRKIIFNGMGILPRYQRLGGNALLYSELIASVTKPGKYHFEDAEMCQINETTDLMLKDMETMGAVEYKRHRVYERSVQREQ